MAIRLQLIIVFCLIANFLKGQQYASWLSDKQFRKYDSIAKRQGSVKHSTIPFYEAFDKWQDQKNQHNSSSYSYIVLSHTGGYDPSTVLTTVYVGNDKVDSSKTVRLVSNGVKYNCIPDIERCPIKLKIDSLKAVDNRAFRKLLVQHVQEHSVVLLKTIARYEGMNNNYAKLNSLAVLDAMTMDGLFTKILDQLGSDDLTIPAKINEEYGYIEHFYEQAIKESDPKDQFMMDYFVRDYFIVDFQWH